MNDNTHRILPCPRHLRFTNLSDVNEYYKSIDVHTISEDTLADIISAYMYVAYVDKKYPDGLIMQTDALPIQAANYAVKLVYAKYPSEQLDVLFNAISTKYPMSFKHNKAILV